MLVVVGVRRGWCWSWLVLVVVGVGRGWYSSVLVLVGVGIGRCSSVMVGVAWC